MDPMPFAVNVQCFHIHRFYFQIQFTIILTQCVLGLAKGCDIPKILVAIYVPNVSLIFYMFYDFFKKAYKKKASDVQKAQKTH